MADFAQQRTMDVWYASLDEEMIRRALSEVLAKPPKTPAKKKGSVANRDDGEKQAKMARQAERRVEQISAKARTRDSLQALSKLGECVDGRYRIVSQPPVVMALRDAMPGLLPDNLSELLEQQFRDYRATLQPDRRHLLEQFEIVDVARKVVGVGSVGTRSFIALLAGRDSGDPLFLQVKEATTSVFEGHLPRSRYRGVDITRHFYWRQLRDMKGSVDPAGVTPLGLVLYARMCGWTMARAHARSGDPVAIAAYLGSGDSFDRAVTDFSQRYADQNELDYDEFASAIKDGQLTAVEGV
jgi:hypothetical protein